MSRPPSRGARHLEPAPTPANLVAWPNVMPAVRYHESEASRLLVAAGRPGLTHVERSRLALEAGAHKEASRRLTRSLSPV